MFALYLWIHNELGDGAGIDLFAVRQGMFIPSFSVIRSACFGFSIDNLRT